MIKLVVGR